MKKSHDDVHKSLLGLSAAGEYHFIANFVALADADRTTYEKAKP
jgi:hypothetical protein